MTYLLRVIEIKTKINKWDIIKLKSFSTTKRNYKKGEKTTFRLANETTDKDLSPNYTSSSCSSI